MLLLHVTTYKCVESINYVDKNSLNIKPTKRQKNTYDPMFIRLLTGCCKKTLNLMFLCSNV